VARLAGLPDSVIRRAREILNELERPGSRPSAPSANGQPDLFATPLHPAVEEIAALDIANLTPVEALNVLDRLKREIGGAGERPRRD
jgi:DNA mismatch repair protein MutS